MRKLTFNYLRVSTKIQNTERQLDNVPCDRQFIDKASGKNRERPALDAMLSFADSG
ncbi:recombinase family protein, partial [Vibrio sp.]